MKKIGLLSLMVVSGMALSLLAGCGSSNSTTGASSSAGNQPTASGQASAGKKEFKVGFAIKTQDSPYFVSLVNAVKAESEKQGWKLTVLDAHGDTSKEAQNMDTFVAQKMDLIFLDSVDPSSAVPVINKAAAAGIGVINLDSGVNAGAKDITTVYSDNKQNGRMVGLAYAKKVGTNKIKAILLSGAKGNVAGQERRTGLIAGIIEGKTGVAEAQAWEQATAFDKDLTSKGKATNDAAGLTVAGQGFGSWTEADGLKAAEDLITANQDLTAVFGENDQMLFGAMTALKNAGIKNVDIVAAADGAKRASDLIKQDQYFATGLNSPTKVAALGVEIAKQVLVDGKDKASYPDVTMTEAVAVTKDNVDQYYDFGF